MDTSSTTGTALVNVDKKGENKILVVPGTNNFFGEEELNILKNRISKNNLLLLQGEIPVDVLVEAARYSISVGASVIFDPALRQ